MIDARAELLSTYLDRRQDLIRFFTARLRSSTAAEDLVQEIYLRIDGLSPKVEVHSPVGYLYRLGSNLMLDRLRSERRTTVRDHEWRASHHTTFGPEDVADQPAADDVVAARQRLAAVIAVLRDLPEQTQRVFRMHKFDGLSHAEVAASLGISRSAVEKHVMTVLKRLAERAV